MNLIVSSLRHFSRKPDAKDLKLSWGQISSDQDKLKRTVLTDLVASTLGSDSTNTFEESPVMVLAMPDSKDTLANLVKEFAYYVDTFLGCLWLVKDNSCHRGLSVAQELPVKTVKVPIVVRPYQMITTCEHKGVMSEFTDDELLLAQSHFEHISERGKKKKAAKFKATKDGNEAENLGFDIPELIKYNDLLLFQRAWSFLTQARRAESLHLKIANYVIVLECLFSHEPTEVTHRVAYRTALFLGKDSDDRKLIAKKVKEAYDIRSKYVHGQKLLSDEEEHLLEIVRTLDDLLRRSIIKFIYDYPEYVFTKDDSSRSKLFNNLLYGE